MVVFYIMLVVGLSVLTFIFVYQGIFIMAAVFLQNKHRMATPPQNYRFAVLIPAHNEEALLTRCLESIYSSNYPRHLRDIYVIADNCTDATAALASSRPLICWERNDIENEGKGYAIEWALKRMNLDAYDAILFLDADAVISVNIFEELAILLAHGEKAIQVFNGTLNADENFLTRCTHLSDILQFRLYFKGRENLGVTSRLLGNGMCLHREVIATVPWKAYSITENWEYYLNVLIAGYRVAFTGSASANSDQVVSFRQGKSQKQRWQIGWRETARKYLPRIVGMAWKEKNAKLIDAAIDFGIPSPAMQAGMMGGMIFGVVVSQDSFLQWWALALALIGGTIVGTCLIVARAGVKDCFAIIYAPLYIGWKIMLWVLGWIKGNPKAWVRTSREAERKTASAIKGEVIDPR